MLTGSPSDSLVVETESTRRSVSAAKQQPSGLFLVLLIAIPLAAVVILHFAKGVPFRALIQDPVTQGGLAVWTGMLSQLGLWFWAASAALCSFTAFAGRTKGSARLCRFALGSAVISLVMGLDDTFLVHEVVAPKFGIAETWVVASYGVCAAVFFLRYARLVLTTRYRLLALGLLGFSASIGLDLIPDKSDPWAFLEDACKFAGLVFWTGYYYSVAARLVAAD